MLNLGDDGFRVTPPLKQLVVLYVVFPATKACDTHYRPHASHMENRHATKVLLQRRPALGPIQEHGQNTSIKHTAFNMKILVLIGKYLHCTPYTTDSQLHRIIFPDANISPIQHPRGIHAKEEASANIIYSAEEK